MLVRRMMLLGLIGVVSVACGGDGADDVTTTAGDGAPSTTGADTTEGDAVATTDGAALDLEPFYDEPVDLDLSSAETDPYGNPGTSADDVSLTDEEIEELRDGGYTAVHLWAGAGEWYNAIDAGAVDRFEELGIEVIANADAQFDPAIQANDADTALTLGPDAVLSLIVDPVSGAEAFRPLIDSGAVLVLADNGAEGYEPGDEYVGIVTGDHFGMGSTAADLMSEAVDGSGAVGMIFHDANFFVTNNRDDSFRAGLEQNHPDVVIVDAKGFTEENATFDAASAMIAQNPDIEGIYVAWDVAAEGVVEAIRAAGRDDISVITHDLGANNALDMAQDGVVYGTVADLPYQVGYTMASLAGYGILDKEAAPFSTVGYLAVTRDNLAEAWEQSLNKEIPAEVAEALGE